MKFIHVTLSSFMSVWPFVRHTYLSLIEYLSWYKQRLGDIIYDFEHLSCKCNYLSVYIHTQAVNK